MRPTFAVHPHKDVAVSLTGAAYCRQSTSDGIYAIPGNLGRSGEDSTARFIGTQVALTASLALLSPFRDELAEGGSQDCQAKILPGITSEQLGAVELLSPLEQPALLIDADDQPE